MAAQTRFRVGALTLTIVRAESVYTVHCPSALVCFLHNKILEHWHINLH